MIARLRGEVIEREAGNLIVEAGGVGYRVAVLPRVWARVKRGQEIALRIYHHVTSDAENLFGFSKKEDLEYFKLLLTVPSVGPRTALGILEAAPAPTLQQAVAEEDITVLTKVSGVGKRTAERILVELKEKIVAPAVSQASGGLRGEAIEALVSIGFSVQQAREAIQKIPRDVETVEEAVKIALQSQRVAT